MSKLQIITSTLLVLMIIGNFNKDESKKADNNKECDRTGHPVFCIPGFDLEKVSKK